MDVNISHLTILNGCDSVPVLQQVSSNCDPVIKPCKRRFWMLGIFWILSVLSGSQFSEFVSMADLTMCYYGVSANAVDWTTMNLMVLYLVLVVPISWLISRVGLRITIIASSVCGTIGFAVQFATLLPDSYAFVMVSSFFVSLSNVCILTSPTCLAAIWFPSEEVSRACAVGVFGSQLGVALGFVISPLLIPGDCSKGELIVEGKRTQAIILTAANVVELLLIIFTFQKEPEHPPSAAEVTKKGVNASYVQSVLRMVQNIHFVLVFIVYGLMVGTYYAFATILDRLMVNYFPDSHVEIGWMGLLFICTGLVGSIIAGFILDYTHKFKETTTSVCLLSFVACVVFSCFLPANKIWIQFLTIGILGFFLTGFLPIGYEYAIEVTFPQSEILSTCLLNSATMIFGLILTHVASYALSYGPTYANIVLCLAILLSAIISCFITKDYKRSSLQNKPRNELNLH